MRLLRLIFFLYDKMFSFLLGQATPGKLLSTFCFMETDVRCLWTAWPVMLFLLLMVFLLVPSVVRHWVCLLKLLTLEYISCYLTSDWLVYLVRSDWCAPWASGGFRCENGVNYGGNSRFRRHWGPVGWLASSGIPSDDCWKCKHVQGRFVLLAAVSFM